VDNDDVNNDYTRNKNDYTNFIKLPIIKSVNSNNNNYTQKGNDQLTVSNNNLPIID
jgi:hypothetical protein